jgi:flavorubredoxin
VIIGKKSEIDRKYNYPSLTGTGKMHAAGSSTCSGISGHARDAMTMREIKTGVYSVGSIDWERRLFDALIPLPHGTSYNAYLVRGQERTALIDTVDVTKEEDLVRNLIALGVDRIDYIVINHTEQDHSGSLPMMLELFPDATVLSSEKGKELISFLLHVPDERCRVVREGEQIPLGGKTLQFLITPWVHWPDTMLTYLPEDRILFSCDYLGSHLATSDLYATDEMTVYESAKRYYAEIMMPFRSSARSHLARLKNLSIEVIAPSHGPVYSRPGFILEAYEDWTSDAVKNEVVIPYVSMHGSTKKMVDHLTGALIRRGIRVLPFNLPYSDIGEIARSLVDAATVVIGTPTVLFGPHPAAMYAAYLVAALHPKTRCASVIGSYGWGGGTVNQLSEILGKMRLDIIDPVIIKGYPKEGDLAALDQLADAILAKHREYGIV